MIAMTDKDTPWFLRRHDYRPEAIGLTNPQPPPSQQPLQPVTPSPAAQYNPVVPTPGEIPSNISTQLDRINQLLEEILRVYTLHNMNMAIIDNAPPVPLTLTYPYDGTWLTIAAGITIFDFEDGLVKAPGVDVDQLTSSLSTVGKDFMRALKILVKKDVLLQFDNGDKQIVHAGIWLFPYEQFKKVQITASYSIDIILSASTNSQSLYSEPIQYLFGNPYVNRGIVASAGTPVELDVHATLGRNAQNGWIANMGTTAGVLKVYNYDGKEWTLTDYTIAPDGIENLEKCDIHSLRIDSDVDGTTFEVNLR